MIQMVVRRSLGAAMPLAGTGCAIATEMLATIAAERGGFPFDATSLTEDYELGLRIAELGGRSLFARVADGSDGGVVAVRAYFPDSVAAATRQKARWMTGIALAGWDRTGWGQHLAFTDHWMRMRDRRAPLSVLVLAVAYAAVILWGLRLGGHLMQGALPPPDGLAPWVLPATTLLLGWRLAMRMTCTWRCYGWREAMWSVPRFFVGNLIALIAAPRALARYLAMLRGEALVWDKTRHDFPALEQGR
ncbi:glycosyltransferase family 2 protein [Sphingomonas sp. GC_Shp_1]|uniref:glycosyltransferase family 2 protein n=1 Tax=unclassified Sphingomonas TaxID=196159 RepID=UPI0031F730EA